MAATSSALEESVKLQSTSSASIRGMWIDFSATLSILVLLAFATELLSLAVLSYLHRTRPDERQYQSFYRNKPWAAQYWKEFVSAYPTEYESFEAVRYGHCRDRTGAMPIRLAERQLAPAAAIGIGPA